jgi:two-component system, NarL family, response regulator LiaR
MRIIICDDQSIIRDGLSIMLNLERDIEVIGVAQDGAEAIELAAQHQPDLILMDLKMPGMNGIQATRQICQQFPTIHVLVLTTYDDDEWIFDAIRAGAVGYLLKDMPRDDVVKAIRGTVSGQSFIDPTVASKLLKHVAAPRRQTSSTLAEQLTGREAEGLNLLAKGCTNSEIAARLYLSEGTVRNHLSAIFAKLNVTDRTQAAVIAIRHGFGNGHVD